MIALGQLLARAARLHAARPCVIDDHGSFSFAEVHARAHALAAALQARGCVPGDRILVSLPNGLDGAIAEIAIPLGGFVKVGLHPRTGEQEARHVIESTTPAAVLASAGSLRVSPYPMTGCCSAVPSKAPDWRRSRRRYNSNYLFAR